MRTAFDFSPLYRSMIGADRLADLVETAMRSEDSGGYPPYDIEKTGENAYRITLAVAGFSPDELELTAQPNLVVVSGRKADHADAERTYLHRGIAGRNFVRRFELADHVVVRGAACADGMLTIELERETPEALKPRRIEIGAPGTQRVERIDRQAARKAA